MGNPIRYIDPDGLISIDVPIVVVGGIVLAIAVANSIDPPSIGGGCENCSAPEQAIDPVDPIEINIWPDDIIPTREKETGTSTRVPVDILPPSPKDHCMKDYKDRMKKCNCMKPAPKAACAAAAAVKLWMCKGSKRPKFGDNDTDIGGGPGGYSGF